MIDFTLKVPVFDECTFEGGIQKWNICCIGTDDYLNQQHRC
jgi:hypothetical protein